MSDKNTKRTSQTDWDRLRAMTDEEIDYSDIPPLTSEFFARAKLVLPDAVQLDPEILVWFKQQGQDYTERINEVLRQHIESQQRAA